MSCGRLLQLLVLLSCLGAETALAQATPDAPVASAEQAYSQHMQNGVRLFNSNDFKTALTEFEAAYRALPKASPLINQALCYRQLSNYPKVVDRLERALSLHQSELSEEDRAAATRTRDEARALLAFLTIEVSPKGAQVWVDGESVEQLDAVPVGPGEHDVRAALAGYLDETTRVRVVSSDRTTVRLTLAPALGELRITAMSSDTPIELDGKIVGKGSFQSQVAPGPHRVRLVGETGTGTVVVVAEKLVELEPSKGVGALPPLPSDAPAQDKPVRGFFGHVNGAVLFPFYHPRRLEGFEDGAVSSGGYIGGRAGYRVHTYAAFEGMLEVGNVEGPANGAGEATYSLTSVRLGPTLRLMSPGDMVRFVGTVGGGLAVHIMGYEDLREQPSNPLCPEAQETCSTNGVDFFAMTEAGLEVDFDGVLIAASAALYLSGTKGMNDEVFAGEQAATNVEKPYANRILPMAGPRVHIGYAFW